jgi:hypothetical protein
MKNIINILLRKLYNQIPNELLELTFKPHQSNLSLDSIIKEEIIVNIVLVDCNLYAGRPTKVTLTREMLKDIKSPKTSSIIGNQSIYYIPPEYREFRDISVILDLAFPTAIGLASVYPQHQQYGRTVQNAADDALTSFNRQPSYQTPHAILLGNNSIKLSPPMMHTVNWIVSCMLSYDDDFTNLGNNCIRPLEKCVLHATEAYIYNKLRVAVNQGYLESGSQLSSISDIVGDYSDANEKYDEAVLRFRGASIFDKETMLDYLSLTIGS